ncbi:MAG: hypothetical protein A3F46_08380 [Legionellales bacterium RIFCSPHIGHO2_12_FULL_42_9]|nr:MAG: hypothetical protein A3F46_08380 [Legionellales bacterium RIFCSPHIGHO2_12_FULL_42_9]
MLEYDLKLYYLQQLGVDCWVKRPPNRNRSVQLMIIGEAPAYFEDKQGKPFVGKAGELLDKMLGSIGLSEQDVYIANVFKGCPPNNRDPAPSEIEACRSFLNQQIQLVAPKLILALGHFAGQFLFGASTSLVKLRSVLHYYDKLPFIVTYHPAFLLRTPQYKRQAYLDLLFLKNVLSEL